MVLIGGLVLLTILYVHNYKRELDFHIFTPSEILFFLPVKLKGLMTQKINFSILFDLVIK